MGRFVRAALVPILFCAAALVVGHQEEILSGLKVQQFDLGDTRWVNYTLEHELRWMLGDPVHPSLWDVPYFWPQEHAGAYADVMPTAIVPYAFWRIFFRYDTAFILWGFTVGCLNFAAMYLLLRRAAKFGQIASSMGAALFAFSNIRMNMTMHWQLFSQYWSVLCLFGIWSATREDLSPRARRIWIFVAILSVSAQLWAGYYLGWFLVFGLLLTAPIALAFKKTREPIWKTLKAFPFTFVGAGVLAGVVLLPLATGYLAAAAEAGMRSFGEVMTMICPPWAWLDLGPHSAFYAKYSASLPPITMEHEQRNGLGFLTLALVLFGVVPARKKPGVVVGAIAMLLIALMVTRFGQFTLWRWVYDYFPGAKAVRSVSRISLLLLIPAGALLAATIDWLSQLGKRKWAPVLGVMLFPAMMVEQAHKTPAFDREQNRRDVMAIASKVPKDCDAFLAIPIGDFQDPYWKIQLDAMWAQLETGIPTINGYSGHAPPGWALEDPRINDEVNEKTVAERLRSWIELRGAQDWRICEVRMGYGDANWDAKLVESPKATRVTAGAEVPVKFSFQNTGSQTWPRGQQVILALQFEKDRRAFGNAVVPFPKDVAPGETGTIEFRMRAPENPGVYPLQFRLLAQGARWFGELPPEFQLEVFGAPTTVSAGQQ